MSARTKSDYSYATITADDLARLTRHFFPRDVQILDFRFEPFSREILGYLGIHELLTIDVRSRGDEKKRSATFFAKSVLPRCNQFQRTAFQVEVAFLRDMAPRLLDDSTTSEEAWSARCYLAKTDMLFLENLKERGYRVTKGLLNLSQLRSLVSCLARFHAASMLLEHRLQRPLNEAYPDSFREKVFLRDDADSWEWLQTGIEVVETVAESLGLDPAYASAAYDEMLRENEPSLGELNVLCHSDLWCENVMFSEDDARCRLVDFQMVTYKCYAIDLVQALHLNTKPGDRRMYEDELIGLYHGTLRDKLTRHNYKCRIASLDEVLEAVERKRACGLVAAVQSCPLALLASDELAAEYTSRSRDRVCSDRKSFVRKALRLDEEYRRRLEAAARELIGFARRRGERTRSFW